ADDRASFLGICNLTSWQVGRLWIGGRSRQRPGPKECSAIFIEVRLVIRSAAIDIVEIEPRRPEILQCIWVVLSLQAARGIEREIVIDELTEVGVDGRD